MLTDPKIGPTQTHEGGEVPRVLLPYDPPEKNVCFIDKLPAELLSHVFYMAMWDGVNRNRMERYLWMDLRRYLATKGTSQEGKNSDVEMTEEDEEHARDEDEDVDGNGDEDEGQDEDGEEDEDVKEEDYGDEDDWTEDDEAYDWPTRTQSSDDSSPRYPIHAVVPGVCHRWRNVAFSTPSLWTMIVVSPQAGLTYERESKLLERSKSLPIDVIIDFEHHRGRNWAGEPSITEITSFFALFVRQVHRWRTMRVTTSEYMPMYLFLRALSNPCVQAAPQLRTLELHLSAPWDLLEGLDGSIMLFTLFGGLASFLTKIVLQGVPVDWNQAWIASASNLTELKLCSHLEYVRPSWVQFATILRGAPALQILELSMSGPSKHPLEWSIESAHMAPIELARLTEFRFTCDYQPHAIALFQRLSLPAIKTLALHCFAGDFTDFLLELAGPATSASTPSGEHTGSLLSRLHTLLLCELVCTSDCVTTVYAELQSLTSLYIPMPSLQIRFLDILGTECTVRGRSDVWLPRLELLYIAGISGNVLRKVMEDRRDAGALLSLLTVYFKLEAPSKVGKADARWLRTHLNEFRLSS